MAQYCIPTSTDNGAAHITNFSTSGGIANITNSNTGGGSYNDYTSMVVSAIQGNNVVWAMAQTFQYSNTAIWVDWNQDGDFLDASEAVFIGWNNNTNFTMSWNFNVPLTATPGSTRMRVRTQVYNNTPTAPSSCGNTPTGETEDYTFLVYPICAAITAVTATPAQLCGPGTTSLSVTYTSNNPVTVKWYDGLGNLVGSGNPFVTNTLTSSTTFYAAADNGFCDTPRVPITINVNPVPPIPVISYINKYCTGDIPSAFTIISGVTIKWYDSATGGVPSLTAPVINTTAPAVFTWYASQTTAAGCESSRIPITVTISQKPHADFNFDIGYACHNDTVHFFNTSAFAGSYEWNFNDGFTDTATHPAHIYGTQGIYYVRLRATNLYCVDSMIRAIDLLHPLQAAYSTSADTICIGSSITFTNTSTATSRNGIDPVYYWDFADGDTATSQSPVHQFNMAGQYNVMMVVKNFVPCSDTVYRLVFVDSIPDLSFTRNDSSICTGDHYDFTARYTQNGLSSLHWNFGDTPDILSDVNPATHAYETPGTYTVTLHGDYRVCPDVSASLPVIVKPLPVINIGPDTSICLDGMGISLSDHVNAGNPQARWLWSTGDTTASVIIKHHGTYTATVNMDQCFASDEVVVAKDCYIDIPNSFTPNNDGTNDYFFPRQFLSEGVAGFTMAVYNRWGQEVFNTDSPNGRGWDGRFNNKDQPVGVYIYLIKVVMKNLRTEEYKGNVTLLR